MMAVAQQFKPDMRPILKLNNIYGIFRATESGLGISALPDYLLPADSNLVRILPELEGPSFDAYFVYPEELRHSKRIAVFRDFLIEEISKVKARMNAAAATD